MGVDIKKIINKEFQQKTIYSNNNIDKEKYPGIKIMEIITNAYTKTNAIIPFQYKNKTYYAGLEFNKRFYQTEEVNTRIKEKISEIKKEVEDSSNDEYVIARQVNKKALYEEGILPQKEGIDVMVFVRKQLSKTNWDKELLHELISIEKITEYMKKMN